MTAYSTQAIAEVKMTLRRGETLLVTMGIPVLLLLFFSLVHVLPTGTAKPVNFLTPGVLALSVMSTAMVSLGIATGFERGYGVLKRLGSTPLGRPALLAAKATGVLAVELAQLVVLVAVALALGWRPNAAAGGGIGAFLLGTVAFAGIGLLMAGTLPAEVTLALANGVYLILLLSGGMLFPLDKLPGPLQAIAQLLPAAALSKALYNSIGIASAVPMKSWLVLAAWAAAAPTAAALTFRWE